MDVQMKGCGFKSLSILQSDYCIKGITTCLNQNWCNSKLIQKNKFVHIGLIHNFIDFKSCFICRTI